MLDKFKSFLILAGILTIIVAGMYSCCTTNWGFDDPDPSGFLRSQGYTNIELGASNQWFGCPGDGSRATKFIAEDIEHHVVNGTVCYYPGSGHNISLR